MKQINIIESKMSEALAQIEAIEGLGIKNKGCLRLLTEEMFSMCKELLDTDKLDFEILAAEGTYTLQAATKTRVKEKAKGQLLSVSSSGKNIASKGIKGVLFTALEVFSYEGNPYPCCASVGYGIHAMMGCEYSWTLSQYMETAPQIEISKEWDGMEKSIIVNFADDVAIGVGGGRVKVIVTKKF